MRYLDIDQESQFIPTPVTGTPVAQTSESLTVCLSVGTVVVSTFVAAMLTVGDVSASWASMTTTSEVSAIRAPPKLSSAQLAVASAAERLFVRLDAEPAAEPDPDYGF